VPVGSFAVIASKAGFADESYAVEVGRDGDAKSVEIVLTVGPLKESVTVTAEVGKPESVRDVPQPVNVIDEESISQRATSVVAQAGEEEAGLNVQRTSPTSGRSSFAGNVSTLRGVGHTQHVHRHGVVPWAKNPNETGAAANKR